jgi:alkanesulfonate monooxygenase SsuD/methylene tetrahydromethanopterin reductase-like flavin-dependent oxidoreductase (luciferase family)
MLGADLAARTSRIRIALGAVSITLWHPLRLAEDLALLDHFSDGRLDVAMGRAILLRDIMNLNPEADRRDEVISGEIFQEHLDIIRNLWTAEAFSHQGKRFNFPYPGIKVPVGDGPPDRRLINEDGEVIALQMVPRPVQQPMPPLYTVSESARGFIMAAEQGLKPITWLPIGTHWHELLDAYADARERVTGTRPARGADTAALRLAFVAETDEEARRITEPAINRLFDQMTRIRGRKVWLDHGEDETAPEIADAKPFDLLLERDHLLIGSPDSVAERMQRMEETYGVSHWLMQMTLPHVKSSDVCESLRLFAEHVAPRFNASVVEA